MVSQTLIVDNNSRLETSLTFLFYGIMTCGNFNKGMPEYGWIYHETVHCLMVNGMEEDEISRRCTGSG